MSIVKLKKITLCGLFGEKSATLAGLQQLGLLHLIPCGRGVGQAGPGFAQSKWAHQAMQALNYLAQCPHKRHQMAAADDFDMARLVRDILKLKHQVRQLTDSRDALVKRIKEVRPWGDFSLPEDNLQGLRFWFYRVPKHAMNKLPGTGRAWQVVHKDNLFDYVVVISEQEPAASEMPVARTHVGAISLSQLKKELNDTNLALEDLQAERESLTRWMGLLAANLNQAYDEADLRNAHALCLDRDGVFVLQAWVAASDLPVIQQFAGQRNLALLSADARPKDAPPTLLANPPQLSGGQDLVNFYQTPNYFDWDPSPVVFFSFALFFAMIVSDAGYGAFFGLVLAAQWRALGRSQLGRRLRALALIVVLATIVWGVLAGSYFGYTPTPDDGIFAQVRILDMNNFDLMMRVSVVVGVSHLALANAIRAYQRRHSVQAWSDIGWLLLAWSGYVAISMPSTPLEQPAYGVMAAGGLLVLLCSGTRPLRRPQDWLWRLLEGLKKLAEITNLFGNVLSYLRLFALGMAGASLAFTFNQLAMQAYQDMPGVGVLFSLIILLIGHALNILLCLMSGVVHGLRLNFIEFYNWSVSDEGYPFKAFAKKGAEL